MRIFISQPMTGRTLEDVQKERERAIEQLKEEFGNDIEIIDTMPASEDELIPTEKQPHPEIEILCNSMKRLSEADYIAFTRDHIMGTGCIIEGIVSRLYNVPSIYLK